MPFRYLRDPLFLACVLAYFVNRLALQRVWESGFVHEHFNDLICLPFWVPIMLWAQRRVGLRRHDHPPVPLEIVVPLLVWSWTFEVVLPATGWLGRYCVADHEDVYWYAVGGLAAFTFWQWWYGRCRGGKVAARSAGGQRHPPAERAATFPFTPASSAGAVASTP